MKTKLAWLFIIFGTMFVSLALADTLKGARVEGGSIYMNDKAYTIDITNKKGQELASLSGIFDVSGKVDPTSMKITIDNFKMASSTTPAK